MLKVYLVDDEEWLISELKNIINWAEYGFEVCGFETDPFAAQKEIIKLTPDLVVCDIHMDGINGLELAHNVYLEKPDIRFCFLSAYDRFDYAVTAMKLGAVDYLTKPLKTAEMTAVLEKVRGEKFASLGKKLVEAVAAGKEYSGGFSSPVRFVSFYGAETISSFADKTFKISSENGYEIFLAFGTDIEKLKNSGIAVGVSPEFTRGDLAENYKIAKLCSRQDFVCGYPCFAERVISPAAEELISEINKTENKYEMRKLVSEFADENGISIIGVEGIFRAIVSASERLGIKGLESAKNKSVAESYGSFGEMTEKLIGIFDAACETAGNAIIESITADIKATYGEKQSLSEYAKKYGFNASYLSWLFKKETGKSFVEFVVALRMSIAKQLMFDTDKTMREISYSVGYDDYFHFSKQFKKYTGYSPTEYKNRYKK